MVPVGDAPDATGGVDDVSQGELSPDGTHWFTEGYKAYEFAMFDSATGAVRRPTYEGSAPAPATAIPYEWLDDDTIAAALVRIKDPDSAQISLLTCHVSTNACTMAAPDIGDMKDVTLPIGITTRGR